MTLKRTKIVATISGKNCTADFIRSLHQEGLNVVRLNTAHQNQDESLKIIQDIRSVSDKIAILIDTKGPEVRTANCDEPLTVNTGETIKVKGDPNGKSKGDTLYVSYPNFVNDVPKDSQILIDDGYIELIVRRRESDYLECAVTVGGVIQNRKSVNVPKVVFNLPCLSNKDRDFIEFAIKNDVDFIAHSFVRNKEDVISIQEILDAHKSDIKIIAKIENQQGVDNIEEILDHAYGVMVARGDLAIEIPYSKIPGIQKMLINKCIERRKPVIIATQMLHSMIDNPRPTRAEVNDIASAIYSNADAIMLSGETAYGKYPVEAVRTMSQVAIEVENSKDPFNDIPSKVINNPVSAYLSKSAVKASIRLDAKALIADTASGRTIRSLAAYRGSKPIYAQCYTYQTMRQLALSYGVYAEYMELRETSHEFLLDALTGLLEQHTFDPNDTIIVLAGNFGRSYGASYIEIGTVNNLIGHLT